MLKTGSAVLGSLLLAAALATAAQAAAPAAKPWLIGQVEALSGPLATEGSRHDKVVRMWAADVNAAGGIAGRPVQIIPCNDEANPEKAVTCARDMIARGVVMIFSNSPTGSSRAILSLVKHGPIDLILSPNVMPPPDSYGFQVSQTAADNVTAVAQYLKASGVAKLGMIAATDASGEADAANARKIFAADGIAMRLARIDLRATDASSELASVATSDVPVIYSSYSGGGAVTVVKSFYNLGLEQPLIVSYGNVSDAFVKLIKEMKPPRLLATGVTALVPERLTDPRERQITEAFDAAYRKRYGEPVDLVNLNALAEVNIAEAVLRRVPDPSDAAAVKHFLETTPIASSRTERFSATNHVGPVAADVLIVELKDGRWVAAPPLLATPHPDK